MKQGFVFAAAVCISSAALANPYMLAGQATPAPASRLAGSLVKVDGKQITLKDAQGKESTILVTDGTKLLQIAPGQTSLAGATPIQLTDMAPGDRLLVLRITPTADGAGNTAAAVVAMKQSDIAQQHAAAAEAWQHGLGGLVKSVDVDGKSVQITNSAGKNVTIKLGPSAVVKRYSAESVQYDQAKPSSLDKIAAGDQLRARGTAGADGSTFQADEVVAGSFRNFSGKITAVDATGGTITLSDLATKQPVQLKVTSDSQLRKLDDATADKLAAAMKPAGDSGGGGGRPAGGPPSGGPPPDGGDAGAGRRGGGAGPGGAGASGGADMQQALAHAPAIQLAQLKRGDLVMVVASSGADNQMGAVTLVTGVEPLLRASPSASASVLASWSLSGGAPAQQ